MRLIQAPTAVAACTTPLPMVIVTPPRLRPTEEAMALCTIEFIVWLLVTYEKQL